mmetsp:Transcript_26122/g.80361  ORF Transcript_26122/g.80361 Transcript_26122/m.80361 type:complete len:183 (+) Transcript_26122:332-880(+)
MLATPSLDDPVVLDSEILAYLYSRRPPSWTFREMTLSSFIAVTIRPEETDDEEDLRIRLFLSMDGATRAKSLVESRDPLFVERCERALDFLAAQRRPLDRFFLHLQRSRCAYCGSSSFSGEGGNPPPLQKCAGCRSVSYCCRDHQRADWRRHRFICLTPRALQAQRRLLEGGGGGFPFPLPA